MARVVITIEDGDEPGDVRLRVNSWPPFSETLSENTDAQGLAMVAGQAVLDAVERLGGTEAIHSEGDNTEGVHDG